MKDFTDCNANVYSQYGELLANVRIKEYDKKLNTVEVYDLPAELIEGDNCDVVILTAPLPHAFKGVVRKFKGERIITLFKGKEAEMRKDARYKADLKGEIEHLIYENKERALHTPLKIDILNISKRGMRLRGAGNSLVTGLRPRVRIKVGKGDQILTAEVINVSKRPTGEEEYGCKLINVKEEKKVRQ